MNVKCRTYINTKWEYQMCFSFVSIGQLAVGDDLLELWNFSIPIKPRRRWVRSRTYERGEHYSSCRSGKSMNLRQSIVEKKNVITEQKKRAFGSCNLMHHSITVRCRANAVESWQKIKTFIYLFIHLSIANFRCSPHTGLMRPHEISVDAAQPKANTPTINAWPTTGHNKSHHLRGYSSSPRQLFRFRLHHLKLEWKSRMYCSCR